MNEATDGFGRYIDIRLGEMEAERGVLSNFHKRVEPYLSITERGLRTPFDRAVDHAATEMRQALEEARHARKT